ncbi:MAG: hypothetical protein M3237_21080, partial [Actinomycetota bacterium]|nr:hypothetical protein [Actinomycetota bacterium]
MTAKLDPQQREQPLTEPSAAGRIEHMFDLGKDATQGDALSSSPTPVAVPTIRSWTTTLAQSDGPATDAERIEALRGLEELKCAAEALQAEITADLDTSQRQLQAAAGVPAERQSRGVAHQIALARRESPHRG